MIKDITGLHHVTSFAGDPQQNNDFHTKILGLRRVKKTVNFDAPDVYHLYYGDETGSAGSVMTYFPFPNIGRARPGTGEVGTTVFSVPEGAIDFWKQRFLAHGVQGVAEETAFGARQLRFKGGDGDGFALVEQVGDSRKAWSGGGHCANGLSGNTGH
jgi:glyoxalase family protein